jgi:hypothetical protein
MLGLHNLQLVSTPALRRRSKFFARDCIEIEWARFAGTTWSTSCNLRFVVHPTPLPLMVIVVVRVVVQKELIVT